jgi:phosphonate transport system ATP-binding protein
MPLWRSLTGFFSKEDQAIAKRALDSVGLEGRYHDKARNLSGGQQQRVAIARALVQQPKNILADEPMASLDPKLSEVVIQMLEKINREQNITVIVNIHVLSLAKKYSKRMIAFRKGEVVFDGPPEELSEEKIEKIYHVDKKMMDAL